MRHATWTEGTKENNELQLEYFQFSKDVIGKLRTGITTRMKHGCGKQTEIGYKHVY
jgi:hypothetical protein